MVLFNCTSWRLVVLVERGGGACSLSRRCHCGDIRLGEGSICGRGNELAGKQENRACKNWSWDSSSLGEYDEVPCEQGPVPIFEHGRDGVSLLYSCFAN